MTGKTHGEPLGIINLAGTEKSLHGIVAGNDKTSQVGQELTAEVEDDEEKV